MNVALAPPDDRHDELTDAELEAVTAGKLDAFKLDAFNSALSRPRGSFGSLARRTPGGHGTRRHA